MTPEERALEIIPLGMFCEPIPMLGEDGACVLRSDIAQAIREAVAEPHNCSFSTGIDGSITAGTGTLDANGYWSQPCAACARWANLAEERAQVHAKAVDRAVAEEREACAKIADAHGHVPPFGASALDQIAAYSTKTCELIAAEIRRRG